MCCGLTLTYISNLFDIDLWDGVVYLIASPCPVICMYLGGLLKSVLKSKHKILAACCIGVICCIGFIAVCMFFRGTDKITSGNGAFFASENKSGKAVYIWDVSSGETYRQTAYSFTGCYGDAYTDGRDLYYTKYDGKGGIRGLYRKPVNASAGHEKTVTTRMLEGYMVGPDLVAYTVNDMDCNKLYICKIANGRETKLTDTCGSSFAVSGQTVCYYDLEDRMIKLENVETGTCTEIEYAKEPSNISATGKSEFAVVSQTGMFCLTDASDGAVRTIDCKEPGTLIENSQIYRKNGELYYLTEDGEMYRKSIKTGRSKKVLDLNDIRDSKAYMEKGYIEGSMFFENCMVISMTASDEKGEAKGTLLMAFDYKGTMLKKMIL